MADLSDRPAIQRAESILSANTRWSHDQKTEIQQVQAVFPQERSEDGQTKKSRHVQYKGRGEETRTRRSVFQAELVRNAWIDVWNSALTRILEETA
jgi:hypothetical protein